jgi:ABC-type uncharacterized transport system substrate-binding protein
MAHIKNKKTLIVSIGVLVLLTAFLLFPPVQMAVGVAIFGIQTGEDVERCSNLVEKLLKTHEFKINSLSAPGNKAVFCTAGTSNGLVKSHDKLFIYSVTEKSEQEIIINKIRQIQRTLPVSTVHVEFYEEENWQIFKDSNGKVVGGRRGKEEKIASFKIQSEP